jgi:hypothetical protein
MAIRLTAPYARIVTRIDRKQAASCKTSQRKDWLKAVASANPLGMYLKSLLQRKDAEEQSEDAVLNGSGHSKATDPNRLRAVVLKMQAVSTISLPRLRMFMFLSSKHKETTW